MLDGDLLRTDFGSLSRRGSWMEPGMQSTFITASRCKFRSAIQCFKCWQLLKQQLSVPSKKVCSHHQCALWTSTCVCGTRAVLLYKENCQFVARPGAFVVARGHTSHFFSFLRWSEHSAPLNPMQNANMCRVACIGGADTCTGSCPCHVVFLTCLFLLCFVFYLRKQVDHWFLHDFGTDTELERL